MKLSTIIPALAALTLEAAPTNAEAPARGYWPNVVGANTPGAFIASRVIENKATGWRMNTVHLLNCNNRTTSYVHAQSLVTVMAPMDSHAVSFCAERGYKRRQ